LENLNTKKISNNLLSKGDRTIMAKKITGFQGDIKFDNSIPNVTPRKILDGSLLKQIGWVSKTDFKNGIESLYSWYSDSNDDT